MRVGHGYVAWGVGKCRLFFLGHACAVLNAVCVVRGLHCVCVCVCVYVCVCVCTTQALPRHVPLPGTFKKAELEMFEDRSLLRNGIKARQAMRGKLARITPVLRSAFPDLTEKQFKRCAAIACGYVCTRTAYIMLR